MPGVPAEPLQPFTQDVRCPECEGVLPAGSLLLVGSMRVEALGKVGPWRRLMMALIPVLPMLWLLRVGLQGFKSLQGQASSATVLQDLGRGVVLVVVGVGIWTAWKAWGRRKGEDTRPLVSWEMQWLVSPGQVELHDRSVTRRGWHDAEVTPSAKPILIPSEQVRAIRVVVPKSPIRSEDGRARSGVELVLELWKDNSRGARRGLANQRICVDAGSAEDEPGLDPRAAVQADGDRLAERVFRLLTGEPMGVQERQVTLRGHPEPAPVWNGKATFSAWFWMILLVVLGTPVVLVVSMASLPQLRGVGLVVAIGVLAAIMVGSCLAISVRSKRGPMRRQLARCVWTADTRGVKVVESRQTSPRAVASVSERLWVASQIQDVRVSMEKGFPRVTLLGLMGEALGAMSPDTLPASGAEASRQVLMDALRGSLRAGQTA